MSYYVWRYGPDAGAVQYLNHEDRLTWVADRKMASGFRTAFEACQHADSVEREYRLRLRVTDVPELEWCGDQGDPGHRPIRVHQDMDWGGVDEFWLTDVTNLVALILADNRPLAEGYASYTPFGILWPEQKH